MTIARVRHRLEAKSSALLLTLENRLGRIMLGWLLVAGLASAARVAVSPLPAAAVAFETVAPYLLLVFAPFASMLLALRWYANGEAEPQPQIRLARVGRWRDVSLADAGRHQLYGAGGIMVSLLVGMLLNVPVRAAEYLVAMPALGGTIPSWLALLHMLLTLDVVLLSSLYVIAFVAALRRVPLFPRLLAGIWLVDLAMQVMIARVVTQSTDLPPAVAGALHGLLEGNVQKVLISAALWLPYLLLSRRVNVTYRHRVEA